ncbi:alpha/beta hydrolase [Marinobacteraceae bacterium S3BR75-40.1]
MQSAVLLRRFLMMFFAVLVLSGTLSGCSSIGAAMEASPTLANAMGVAEIPLDDLKERYTNEHSKFVEINGYNIHYQDQGSGDPIILMHGIFSALQTWDGWVEELKKTHRVIALDMPGYGLTGGPENLEDFDADNVLNTVAKFIDELDLRQVSIAGNSLGGFIAASYAAKYPARVDKLILLDPFGYPQETPWILGLATFPPIAFIGNYIQPPIVVTLNVRWVYGDPRRIKDKDIYRYVRMNQRPGAKPLYVKTLKMIDEQAKNLDPRPFYRISAPTLLMWGEEDDWIPLKIADKWLNDIPNAKLITYPTVGHMPMEEVPETSVKDAEKFLDEGLGAFKAAAQNDPEYDSESAQAAEG